MRQNITCNFTATTLPHLEELVARTKDSNEQAASEAILGEMTMLDVSESTFASAIGDGEATADTESTEKIQYKGNVGN